MSASGEPVAGHTFGGTVESAALQSDRTRSQDLEEARARGRSSGSGDHRRIEARGSSTLLPQSVTGWGWHGVVATVFSQVAGRATSSLRRHGYLLPTARQLHRLRSGGVRAGAVADLRRSRCGPGTRVRACTLLLRHRGGECYAPRQNRSDAHDFERSSGCRLIGIEPEMMWLKKPEPGHAPEAVTKPTLQSTISMSSPVLMDVSRGRRSAWT